MIIEIERSGSEYILRTGGKEQSHPTLINLMRSIITTFHETTGTESPERTETPAPVEIMNRLINYLLKHHFTPSQVIDVLEHLESAVQRNLGAVKEHTVQLQLIHELHATPEFTEAHPFATKLLIPQQIGKSIIHGYNGSLALQRRGFSGITVYVNKTDLEHLTAHSRDENHEFLTDAGIPEPKRTIIIEYIEDLKDEKLGMYPMVRTATRISGDAGEIGAEEFEQAGW